MRSTPQLDSDKIGHFRSIGSPPLVIPSGDPTDHSPPPWRVEQLKQISEGIRDVDRSLPEGDGFVNLLGGCDEWLPERIPSSPGLLTWVWLVRSAVW